MAILSRLRGNPWVVLTVPCLGLFMALLDTTIVNIAVPSIIDGLEASLDEILWVLNAYVLVSAALSSCSRSARRFSGTRSWTRCGRP